MAENGKPGNFCMWVGNRAIHDIAFTQFLEDLDHKANPPSQGVKHHAMLGALVLAGIRPKNALDPIEVSVLYMQLRTPYGGAGGLASPVSLAVASEPPLSGGGVVHGEADGTGAVEWGKFVRNGELDSPDGAGGMDR